MPQTTYAYKVRDSSGKVLEGTLEADNTGLVASRLRQMGYIPVNIEARSGASVAMKKDLHLPGIGERVPLKELAVFSRQFATLINSGLTLFRALHPGGANRAPRPGESRGRRALPGRNGASPSRPPCLAPQGLQPAVFAMVRAGEASGSLDKALAVPGGDDGKAGGAAGQDQVGHGLPDAALVHRGRHRGGSVAVHRARLQGHLQEPQRHSCRSPRRSWWTVSTIMVKFSPLSSYCWSSLPSASDTSSRTPNGRVVWDTTKLKVPSLASWSKNRSVPFRSTFSALLRRAFRCWSRWR